MPRAIAALLILTACLFVGGRSIAPVVSVAHSTTVGGTARAIGESVDPPELAAVLVAPSLHGLRVVENRIAPLWLLAGLAASISAFELCRRRRVGPTVAPCRAVRRGRVASRAPPLASIA